MARSSLEKALQCTLVTHGRFIIWRLWNDAMGIRKRRLPISTELWKCIRNCAMRAANWASLITSRIVLRTRWKQFEALQAIDPDDLAAHYNLAILYRRKGMKVGAAAQAAQYATIRVDPAAPTYSLDYLRRHPEIST